MNYPCLKAEASKRFSKDFNHRISKYISNLDYGTFVLENLKFIRTKKIYNKKANKWLSSWSFFQFEQFLTYKAEAKGKKIEYINPKFTSQKCSNCGKIEKSNRSKSKYQCSCGYHNHSDINAAINIKNLFLSTTPYGSVEQVVVNQPHVTTSGY